MNTPAIADLILTNGRFHTLDRSNPQADAVAIADGRFVAVGDAADVMRHRLVLSYEALSEDISADRILATILQRVPAPTVPLREHAVAACA